MRGCAPGSARGANGQGRPCAARRSGAARPPGPRARRGRWRARSRGRRSRARRSRSAPRRGSRRPDSCTCLMISKLRSTRIGARPMDGSSISSSFGLRHQRAPHRHHLLLAAGQRPRELGAPLVEQREERVDALVVLLRRAAVQVRAHLEVLEHAHRREQAAVLGDDRHPLRDPVARLLVGHVLAVEPDPAGARLHDAERRLQRRRLARRVAAEQADELAGPDLDARVVEDVDLRRSTC